MPRDAIYTACLSRITYNRVVHARGEETSDNARPPPMSSARGILYTPSENKNLCALRDKCKCHGDGARWCKRFAISSADTYVVYGVCDFRYNSTHT